MNVDSDHGRSQSRDHVPIQTGTPTGSQIRSMSLKDGTRCQIRPIGRDDPDVVNACFAGLSPASRRLRFFSAKQALTAADLAYLTNADGRDHLAFAAIGLDQDGRDGEVLGAARCIRSAPGSETAELAIAVVDRAQGKGVGTALLDRLTEAAREQGIRRFHFEVLADNDGMRTLASRLGGRASWLDDGAVKYDCALPEPASRQAVEPVSEGQAPRYRSGASYGSDGLSSWERACKTSIAVFETAVLAWFDFLSPIQLGRRGS